MPDRPQFPAHAATDVLHDVSLEIAAGEFGGLRAWLGENIHRLGRLGYPQVGQPLGARGKRGDQRAPGTVRGVVRREDVVVGDAELRPVLDRDGDGVGCE